MTSGDHMAVKVGIVGAGVMGADHARILATSVAGAELMAVSDPDSARRNALAADLGIKASYGDAMELIADPDVTAVIVASPDSTHKPLTLACLDRSEEHTSELQSRENLVCRLLLDNN